MLRQISIFLENKSGRVSAVTEVLKDAGINIRALSVADTTDFGILRLMVDNVDKAFNILKKNQFSVSITDVIAVVVDDTPGGLHKVLFNLGIEKINIEYMYAFITRNIEDKAIIIFRIDDVKKAVDTLNKAGFKVLSSEELFK
jgi:hypothetical protein